MDGDVKAPPPRGADGPPSPAPHCTTPDDYQRRTTARERHRLGIKMQRALKVGIASLRKNGKMSKIRSKQTQVRSG